MSSNTKLRASPSQDDPSVNSSPFKVTEARQQRVHRGCCGHTQHTIPCLLESLFSGVFVVPLYRENLYLFFILFSGAACILSTHRTLSLLSFTSGTLVARTSLMQPLLMLTTFATCMVGIVCTKSQLTRSHRICPLHMSWYSSRLNRRLQRALWCVPVALALYTIACLPIPTDRHYSVSSLLTLSAFCRLRGPSDWETPLFNNSAQLNGTAGTTKYLVTPSVDVFRGLWPLIFATLNIQSLLVGLLPLTIRLLICASIAGLHSAMVLVSHFAATLPPPKPYFLSDDYIVFECSPTYVAAMEHTAVAWWNSAEMYFWRGFAVNLLSFVSANLVGYHLARLKELAQWRCLFVVLSSSARSRHLQLAQSKLSIVSRSLVPAPLAADLEQDFTSGVCSWTSPLVIYLRNVSFMSAELVGFCTSAGDPSDARACTEAELVVDGPGGITGPSPGHVISFLNQLMSQVNSIAETHGCYPVHLRPSEILCVAGYPDVRVDHAHSCVQLALEIRRLVR
nr:unnamed protein product [Spirometra erinaceieuropaei]